MFLILFVSCSIHAFLVCDIIMPQGSKDPKKQPVGPVGASYNLRSGKLVNVEDATTGQVGTTKMAGAFKSRDDPDYLKFMEKEVLKAREEREEQSRLLGVLVTKMEGLDVKFAPQAVGGRGVLRTPLKDFPPTVGRGRGAGPVHNLSSQLLGASKSPSLGLDPTAAEMVNGQLTSILQQLSIAIDPTPQASMKGLLLRPEYYVQHIDKGTSVKSLNHTKMSLKELMSGMSRVMLHLDKSGGDLGGYLEHFSFIARKAEHGFVDSAYVSYDRLVMDQYINGESDTIVRRDPFAVALSFHVGNLAPAKPVFPKPGRGRGFRRGGRFPYWNEGERDKDKERDREHQVSPSLEGFPENICYNYNYRVCHGKCARSHICRMCRGPHKASSGSCTPNKK